MTGLTGRLEDPRMLTGAGRYVADFVGPGTLHAGFVRADRASARIAAVEVEAAAGLPGVVAVYTAADLERDGVGPITHPDLPRDDSAATQSFPIPLLCGTEVRHAGEPVVMIIAETAAQLADAMEAVWVDLEDGAPVEGVAFLRRIGDLAATEEALASAHHRHKVAIDVPRVTALALEPRCAIARCDTDGSLHYRTSTQSPFAVRSSLARQLGLDKATIRVVAEDVGGSFGLKAFMTREDALLAWAAKKLLAEIAWIPTRLETIIADAQGRGLKGTLEIGLDADLSLTAISGAFDVDAGAYPDARAFGIINNINGITGMYRVPVASAEVVGHLSPRPQLVPFRGNGRPEATHAIERALDVMARRIGADPFELRQRNLIGPAEMPVTTGLGTHIDCGDFPKVMGRALEMNKGAEARRRDAEARGMLYGIGLANCIESAGGPLAKPRPDFARLTVDADGTVTVAPGVMSVGQGHETVLSDMVADQLQIDADRVHYRGGDTEALSQGRGSGGSAGVTVGGSALWTALDDLIQIGTRRASEALECAETEITYRDGAFHRDAANQHITLAALAEEAGGLDVESQFAPETATFPNGTHICEVEIDPQTGVTRVVRYVGVEDVGRVLNPVMVAGQLHGGIAQGLSIGLGERLIFDAENQPLTGTLMDYALARAADLPMIETGNVEVPTALNPLGVKGVGEAGAVGGTAAMASAVFDALWRAGVEDFELPATPCRVWQALNDR